MKYSIAFIAAGAALVAAQDISTLPECGVSYHLDDDAAIGVSRFLRDHRHHHRVDLTNQQAPSNAR